MIKIKSIRQTQKQIERLKRQLQEQKEVKVRLRNRLSKSHALSQQRYKEAVELRFNLKEIKKLNPPRRIKTNSTD